MQQWGNFIRIPKPHYAKGMLHRILYGKKYV